MDQSSSVLLDLIKSSLWGTPLPDYDSLYDEPIDWEAVFEEAKIQTVAGIAAPAVPDSVPKEIKSKWNNYSYMILANYHKVLVAQDQLLALLKENNIPVAILKGSAAAIYYPNPSQRNMGDIDFLVPQDLFDSTEKLLRANDYTMTQDRSSNPRHSGFVKNGVHFELHHHFSHTNAPDIEQYLIDGFNQLEAKMIGGHEFTMLPPLANGLVLLDHMRCHLKSGLGLRQVIDWMMYVKAEVDDSFWNAHNMSAIRNCGLYTLTITTTKMCHDYLGIADSTSWYNKANGELCLDLIETIFSYGNFGRKKGEGNSIETVQSSIIRDGLFTRLQRSGEYNWKAYKKHHWLKPFCWIYQTFRYIKQGLSTKRGAKQIKSDFDEANKREILLKQLEI